ncbi:MAG: hypothetical protein WBJ75_05435 [Pseudohongiellaceae bacterium]|nr:MAG: hypothetical protein A3H44_08240 [Gammaproteobacteria bacterium RIFCSPLOWO2_02_FULL_57_10]
MALPPLVHYATLNEYRLHYEQAYCRNAIHSFDGIRVHFSPDKFDHMFYESSARDGRKDVFSPVRAQRIDWIKATLEHPEAALFEGWDKVHRRYDATRRVAVVYEDFVVIVVMRLNEDGNLKANFVTCYQADNSIGKIRNAPTWSLEGCLRLLGGKP